VDVLSERKVDTIDNRIIVTVEGGLLVSRIGGMIVDNCHMYPPEQRCPCCRKSGARDVVKEVEDE
jgi:hypothetical protein